MVIFGLQVAFEKLEESPELQEKLAKNTEYFR